VISAAASSIRAEVFGLVAGVEDDPGFRGKGGGARSGSLLSHLENHLLSAFRCQKAGSRYDNSKRT
jgi:hypothetical protein